MHTLSWLSVQETAIGVKRTGGDAWSSGRMEAYYHSVEVVVIGGYTVRLAARWHRSVGCPSALAPLQTVVWFFAGSGRLLCDTRDGRIDR